MPVGRIQYSGPAPVGQANPQSLIAILAQLAARGMGGGNSQPRPEMLKAAEPDMSMDYNTGLSPEEEAVFQQWAKSQGYDPRMEQYDYDLRGMYKSGTGRDPTTGHGTDYYKKPNHMTFSNQSEYSGQGGFQGGSWTQNDDGSWTFTASPTNLRFHSPEELQRYFAREEQGNKLVLP